MGVLEIRIGRGLGEPEQMPKLNNFLHKTKDAGKNIFIAKLQKT